MVGSTGMAQNFTNGAQPFCSRRQRAGRPERGRVDAAGTVVASFTPQKAFGMVLVSSPAFAEGGTYTLTVGGTVAGANADGYTEDGASAAARPPPSRRPPPPRAAWAAWAWVAAACPPACPAKEANAAAA